jgi:hypothetical protein
VKWREQIPGVPRIGFSDPMLSRLSRIALGSVLPALLYAAVPPAEEIMARVAANQARSQAARSSIVYQQKVLVRKLRGGGQVAREEEHQFTVAPTPDGATKTRTYFRGSVRHKGELLPFGEPEFRHSEADMDAELAESLVEMTESKDRDGISSEFFPLTSERQHKYQFRLEGQERINGHDTYAVAFEPRTKGSGDGDRAMWRGTVYVDRVAFQPVYLTTSFAWKVPLPIRVALGTNVQQVGFALRYEEVEDGLWFPVSYGGEFKIKLFFLYGRTATLSLENSDFQRTQVESEITFDEVAGGAP